MNISEIIEKAADKVGGQKKLAEMLEIHPNNLTNVKRGERGLPAHACAKLAEITGYSFVEVVAASELATEKKEERRKYWESLLKQTTTATLATVFLTSLLTFGAPNTARAAQVVDSQVCIMSNY
ncbi:MAG: YdaS family helix-turn-helix protein [Pseudomonadota bacterium]